MDIEKIVGRKLNRMNTLVAKEAYKRGVKFTPLKNKRFKMSLGDYTYVVRKGRIVSSPNFGLATKVVTRKEVLNRILTTKGYNCPENAVFKKEDIDRAWNWAKPILPIVLKPARGQRGKSVFVNINEFREFIDCFDNIASEYDEVLIEEFIQGEEYRFTFIYDELIAISKRVPANVTGDGKSSVKELINRKNELRKKNPIHKKIKKDEETVRVLSRYGFTYSSIPKKGEKVFLRDNSNVSTGGDAIDMTDKIPNEIKEEVTKAVKFINGLEICGADIIINQGKPFIIEINTEPMLLMHMYPWEGQPIDVIGKIVDGMFPNTKAD